MNGNGQTIIPLNSRRNFTDPGQIDKFITTSSNSNQYNQQPLRSKSQYNERSAFIGKDACPVRKENCPPRIENYIPHFGLQKNCWRWISVTGLAEMIGVFTFVFIGCSVAAALVASPEQMIAGSFAFGFGLLSALIITSPWHTHLNPTVTILLYFFENEKTRDLWYVFSRILGQFAGGFLAAWFVYIIFGQLGAQFDQISTVVDPLSTGYTAGEAILMEIIGAFVLHMAYLIVSVAMSLMIDARAFRFKKCLILGFVLLCITLAAWNVTGGAFNHVRWLPAATISGSFAPVVSGSWWVYIVGPIVGAILAGLLFFLVILLKDTTNPDNRPEKSTM